MEITPAGSQPATSWSGGRRSGFDSAVATIRSEPGPEPGQAAVDAEHRPGRAVGLGGRTPVGVEQPAKLSPREWATMNHGGTPAATSAPTIEPAEVPTM